MGVGYWPHAGKDFASGQFATSGPRSMVDLGHHNCHRKGGGFVSISYQKIAGVQTGKGLHGMGA
jgi:hypothetical protein